MHSTSDFLSKLSFIKSGIVSNWDYHFDSAENLEISQGCNLGDLFCEVATRQADRPAISTSVATWSYHSLLAAAHRISNQLKSDSEYKPGNRVILLVPNSIEYIAAFYGILISGGVVVPLPANTESGTLQKILESTEASYVISTSQILSRQSELQGLQSEMIRSDVALQDSNNLEKPATTKTDHLAAIFFTAGSSGTPKGVMLSHSNLISNARSIQEYLELKTDERPLCVLPFHHAFGNSVLQSHILLGSHLILDANTLFPESIVKAVNSHRCTSLSAVPDLFRILLERTSFAKTELPSLRYMSVAGGALPHHLSMEIRQCINPACFYVMYGQTEATARLA
ncbi:MAG: AMP-binding protein, partial [Gimesia sp.]